MTKPLLLLGLLAASSGLAACAEYDYPPPPRPYPGEHVRWCLDHHPGYDPATNLFPDAYGRPHVCRFQPYGPPPPPPPPPAY